MATSTTTAPKAKSTRGKSSAAPDRPARPIPGLYTPKPGDRITCRPNTANAWDDPDFGDSITVTVDTVRDLIDDPLGLADLARFATGNIGRHLIDATDEIGDHLIFFLEDCYLETIECNGRVADFISPQHQSCEASALRIVYRDVTTVDLNYCYGPTAAERLQLIEMLGRLKHDADGDPLDNFRVRPVPMT